MKNKPLTIFSKENDSLDIQKFKILMNKSTKVLLRISSIFPFDLFPDELTIDEFKVSIHARDFFFSEDIHSIPIVVIRDVDVYVGPFFATLKIVPDGYPGHALEVHYLKRKEAVRARKLIEGLIIARKQGIDPVRLSSPDIDNSEIEKIGSTHLIE